jgi:GTP-binding protein
VVVRGGRGGRGNAAFKTAHNSAPRLAENGEQGEALWLELELKLVADVGIIGVPNAGKSTLLSRVSAARPKVADYPFTTVEPTLGVAEIDHHPIVVVDIPGLLEGAHEGVGLGLEFLRHIERCRVLIHLLDGASPDPVGDLEAVNQELMLFNPALASKPQRVVLNKLDLPAAQAIRPAVEAGVEATQAPLFGISALTGEGVPALLREIWRMLAALPTVEPEERVELVPRPDHKAFRIDQIAEGVWQVEGVEIEKVAQMTHWDYYEAALRFQRVLSALGIKQALVEAGIEEGDSVRVGNIELVWGYENAFGS